MGTILWLIEGIALLTVKATKDVSHMGDRRIFHAIHAIRRLGGSFPVFEN